MELLCWTPSKNSQLPHYQCLGWTIWCYFPSRGWIPQSYGNGGDYTQCGIKRSQAFSTFISSQWQRGGTGELEAKESICQLDHWMDASSIEALWWLQGSLLCGNAIGKAVTACTVIRPNDLDSASLMTTIHSVQMAGNLSNMTLSHMNKQESTHTYTHPSRKWTWPGDMLRPLSADNAPYVRKGNPKCCHHPIALNDERQWGKFIAG